VTEETDVSATKLFRQIDRSSGVPIHLQLADWIRLLIREGTLQAGEALPTVRSLAVELGINANTVARVYRDLQASGLLRLERGVGTFVADTQDRVVPPRDFRSLEKKALELIRLAKQAEVTIPEVCQLIERRWQEVDHAQR